MLQAMPGPTDPPFADATDSPPLHYNSSASMNVLLTITHIFGLVTMGFSGLMATCLLTAAISDDGAMIAFLEGSAITLLAGALMFF